LEERSDVSLTDADIQAWVIRPENRAKLVELIDGCNALDACKGVNDPDRAAETKETAFQASKVFFKSLFGDLISERLSTARLTRSFFKPSTPWSNEAIEAGRGPVAPASPNMDPDEAAAQRWMITRFLTDFEDVLQPNLGRNGAGAMLSLNLGVETPLTKPLRVKGLSRAPTAVLQFFKALLAYYRAGYRGSSIEQILLDDAELFDGMGYETLKSIVQRLGMAEMARIAKAAGAADKAAKRPEDPEYVGCKDFIAFMSVKKGK
jgi:hypothetical protein